MVERVLRIYRQRQGNLDGWRRYVVKINDVPIRKLSSLELLEIEAHEHPFDIQFSRGEKLSERVRVRPDETRALVVVTTANPKIESPQIRTYWVDADELKQQVQRFDRPPYVGGRLGGLCQAIGATLFFVGLSITFTIGEIVKGINQPSISTISFLFLVGGAADLIAGFIAASGIRALFFYFRMPSDLR